MVRGYKGYRGPEVHVAQQAGKNYQNLQKALVVLFGEKPYEYFYKRFSIRKEDKETHRDDGQNRIIYFQVCRREIR